MAYREIPYIPADKGVVRLAMDLGELSHDLITYRTQVTSLVAESPSAVALDNSVRSFANIQTVDPDQEMVDAFGQGGLTGAVILDRAATISSPEHIAGATEFVRSEIDQQASRFKHHAERKYAAQRYFYEVTFRCSSIFPEAEVAVRSVARTLFGRDFDFMRGYKTALWVDYLAGLGEIRSQLDGAKTSEPERAAAIDQELGKILDEENPHN